jgi:hypothetical protein
MNEIFYVLIILFNIGILTYGIVYMKNAYKETDEKNNNSKTIGMLIISSGVGLLLLSMYGIYEDIKEKRVGDERMRWGGY